MSESQKRILVIGMGNVLMQDEGIGVRAVEELENRYLVPEGVTVIDGGTTGTELYEPMRECDILIVADAINTGQPSGAVARIANEDIPAFFQTKLSNHQLGLSDLLGLLQLKGEMPEEVVIVGMVPHALNNKLGLTPEAEAGLQTLVDMILMELGIHGVELQPRDELLTGHWKKEAEYEALHLCA